MSAAPGDRTDGFPPVHIVGLYKCGTTWLLRILAAHPQVVAWREFDPVRDFQLNLVGTCARVGRNDARGLDGEFRILKLA